MIFWQMRNKRYARSLVIGAVCFLLIAISCRPFPARAQQPPGKSETGLKSQKAGGSFLASLDIIRSVITRADSDRCPMWPSCSTYAHQAFQRHGALMGWIMTCDRLMRCGRDEVRLAPKLRKNGRVLIYDPVQNNDFWWHNQR